MKITINFGVVVLLILARIATAQPRPIDVQKSEMKVRVFKTGVFSAFGHNHEIVAPIASGVVDVAARRVELRVSAAALRVRDPDTSDKDRKEIQKTMLGPDVLAVSRYPRIVFRSTAAEPAGTGSLTISGQLTLHGQTRPITVEAHQRYGHYVGTARLKQSDFGMKPIKVAGGAASVKDGVQVEFDVWLVQK